MSRKNVTEVIDIFLNLWHCKKCNVDLYYPAEEKFPDSTLCPDCGEAMEPVKTYAAHLEDDWE